MKNTDLRHEFIASNVYRAKRMPKGWELVGTNEMTEPYQTHTQRYKSMKNWHRMFYEAQVYNLKKKHELEKIRNMRRNEVQEESNAEALVEKKYRKDKTQKKISSSGSIEI